MRGKTDRRAARLAGRAARKPLSRNLLVCREWGKKGEERNSEDDMRTRENVAEVGGRGGVQRDEREGETENQDKGCNIDRWAE